MIKRRPTRRPALRHSLFKTKFRRLSPADAQQIVLRPASSAANNATDSAVAFPDDFYQIQIVGGGSNSIDDLSLHFRLDRGAQVLSVIPQPITRAVDGSLTQVPPTLSDPVLTPSAATTGEQDLFTFDLHAPQATSDRLAEELATAHHADHAAEESEAVDELLLT